MASSVSSKNRSIGSLRHPFLFFLSLGVAPALWTLFVENFNPHELLVGALASGFTVAFLTFVFHSSDTELALLPRSLFQIWRVPSYIAVDVYIVTLVLAKDLLNLERAQSLYRVCGFDTSDRDPVRKARIIMATAFTTASPNIIVIGIDSAQSRMLFHQIQRSQVPKMARALGARP